jgi:hypothetical protein
MREETRHDLGQQITKHKEAQAQAKQGEAGGCFKQSIAMAAPVPEMSPWIPAPIGKFERRTERAELVRGPRWPRAGAGGRGPERERVRAKSESRKPKRAQKNMHDTGNMLLFLVVQHACNSG